MKAFILVAIFKVIATVPLESEEVLFKPNERAGRSLNDWAKSGNIGNPEEQGNYLEGDIMLQEGRNGVYSESQLWDKGIVPYELKGKFSQQQKDTLSRAFEDIMKNTCIKFTPHGGEKDYVAFTSDSTGCWSLIGKIGGMQQVNLQSECFTKVGTVIHEVCHTLGFSHEQNRSDRDSFVTIQNSNIPEDKKINFAKIDKDKTFNVAYDYGSVLHYSATAFSKNGQPTIISKGGKGTSEKMGQRDGLSASDIKKLNLMYKCKK